MHLKKNKSNGTANCSDFAMRSGNVNLHGDHYKSSYLSLNTGVVSMVNLNRPVYISLQLFTVVLEGH